MKKLGLNELFGALIAGIITAMCFTPSKPAVAPPYILAVAPPPPIIPTPITPPPPIPPPPAFAPSCPAGTYPFWDPETAQYYCLPYPEEYVAPPPEIPPTPTEILLAPAAVAPAAPSQTITTVEAVPVVVTTTPVSPTVSPSTGNVVTGVVTSSKSGQIAEVQVSPVGQEVIFPTQISRYVEGTPIPAGSSLHTEGGVTYVVPTETISGTTQPITVSKYDPMTNTWVNVV